MKLVKKSICIMILISFIFTGCSTFKLIPKALEYYTGLPACFWEGFGAGAAVGVAYKLINEKGDVTTKDLLKAGLIGGITGGALSCLIVHHLKKRNEILIAQKDSLQDRVNIARQTNKDLEVYKNKLAEIYDQRKKELTNLKNMRGQSQKKLAKAKKLQTKIKNDIKSTENMIIEAQTTLTQLKKRKEKSGSSKDLDNEIAEWTNNLKELKGQQNAFASINTEIENGRI